MSRMTNGSSSEDGARTASQAIHRLLRDEIVSMRRLPGSWINEKEIAADCGVSRTPVREALLRLADERLVEIVPKSGTIVARIPAAVLPDIIMARRALERQTVTLAAEKALGSEIANLRAIVERQREAEAAGDAAAFHAADEAMHAAIAATAGHATIWSMIEQIKVQLDRYRRLTLPRPHRIARAIEEHAGIVEAIAAHDPERAGRLMDAHLDGLSDLLDKLHEMEPDYFA